MALKNKHTVVLVSAVIGLIGLLLQPLAGSLFTVVETLKLVDGKRDFSF